MTQQHPTKWGDKDMRRQDIMQAAQKILETDGYEALSIRNVAKEAKISAGLLYSYFANKEELFAALYAEKLVEFQQQLSSVCTEATSIEQLFIELLTAYLPVYKTFGKKF